MPPKQNIQYLDTLRVLATIGVIIIHVSTPVVKMSYPFNLDAWWVGNFIDAAMRFCVPLFLVLSGATLLAKEYPLVDFYKKRFMRVLLPFLFWAVVYLIYSWIIMKDVQRPYGFVAIKDWAIQLYVEKGISVHFWFIYMLLFLYLFVPFLGMLVRRLSNKTILIVLLVWFVVNCLFQFKLIDSTSVPLLQKLILNLRYAGFLVLGYYVMKQDFSALRYRYIGALLFVGSLVFVALYTFHLSEIQHKLDLSTYFYLSPYAIIQTVGIYFLLAETVVKNKVLAYIRDTISDYSFGIYLVHIIAIGVLYLNKIFWTMGPPIISVPFVTLLVLVISFGLIYLLRKIPGGKFISG